MLQRSCVFSPDPKAWHSGCSISWRSWHSSRLLSLTNAVTSMLGKSWNPAKAGSTKDFISWLILSQNVRKLWNYGIIWCPFMMTAEMTCMFLFKCVLVRRSTSDCHTSLLCTNEMNCVCNWLTSGLIWTGCRLVTLSWVPGSVLAIWVVACTTDLCWDTATTYF